MKYHKVYENECHVKKCCHTCQFNMYDSENNWMVCAANNVGELPYGYGQEITDDTKCCDNYRLSFHEFQNMASHQWDDAEKYLY